MEFGSFSIFNFFLASARRKYFVYKSLVPNKRHEGMMGARSIYILGVILIAKRKSRDVLEIFEISFMEMASFNSEACNKKGLFNARLQN